MLLIQLRDTVEIVEAHPVSYIPITSLFTGLTLEGRASYLLRFSGKRCPLAVGFATARSSCATPPPHKKESQSHYKKRKQINSDFVLNTWFSKQRNNNPHSKNNTVKKKY